MWPIHERAVRRRHPDRPRAQCNNRQNLEFTDVGGSLEQQSVSRAATLIQDHHWLSRNNSAQGGCRGHSQGSEPARQNRGHRRACGGHGLTCDNPCLAFKTRLSMAWHPQPLTSFLTGPAPSTLRSGGHSGQHNQGDGARGTREGADQAEATASACRPSRHRSRPVCTGTCNQPVGEHCAARCV